MKFFVIGYIFVLIRDDDDWLEDSRMRMIVGVSQKVFLLDVSIHIYM